ncbi:MAG: class II aldolase/adducin family protein [Candidatus Omnitrophica bacterium]|nr:class II aldolase/adducin family protein [Candidatus Omnitrophota bacterium]
MKPVISAKEVQELLRKGGDPASLPANAIYTPSARDLLRELQDASRKRSSVPAAAPAAALRSSRSNAAKETPTAPAPAPAPAAPPSSASAVEKIFHSPEVQALKEKICDIGRRLWSRAYVDGNGGNISVRISDELVLCTPTLVSKGFMKPEDMCLVDMEGNQKAGTNNRTSEILMHLQIMKVQPKAKSVVHCHPPYATAFALAGVKPPTCMIPEIEVFIGEVPVAPYFTPGTPEMGKHVADLADTHNTILMGNHGAVSWSHSPEDAYFKMEILEAYCRSVVVATQLGVEPKTFKSSQLKDLLKIKQKLGIPDPRFDLKECELCDNSEWRPGVVCQVPAKAEAPTQPDPDAEKLVQSITDMLLARIAKG